MIPETVPAPRKTAHSKIFDHAALKLTAVYTTILFAVCISFSTVIYTICLSELHKPFRPSMMMSRAVDDRDIDHIIRARADDVQSGILLKLIVINAAVLVAGAIGSYFLARLTLRPIDRAMDAQSRFVSDASHELRTPLAVIAMENEVLLRDKKSSPRDLRSAIKSNLEEVGKLRELTDRLLCLSQDEPIVCSEVIARDAIKLAIKNVESCAKDRKINVEIVGETDRKIVANKSALIEILTILLDNAIKYSPENSRVEIGDDGAKIFVRDFGSGIADTDLPHIFERFYRAETSRTSDGYGLGLALAAELATKMNLKISVENNPETGVTFSIH